MDRCSWYDLLEMTGFNCVENHVNQYPEKPEHLFSAMWSTKRDNHGVAHTVEV